MTNTPPLLDDFLRGLATPAIYPQKLDPARAAVLLIRLDEAGYRAASFLDDRILNANTEGVWAPLARVAEAAMAPETPRPLRFIFHIGHVGSTLLSRLLDQTGHVLGLREPLPLRQLADSPDAGILDTFAHLWARGFPRTRTVVVKATSSAARLAPQLFAARPNARAVYMYLPAEPYLATLLAGENSPLDLKGHQAERTKRLAGYLGEAAPAVSTPGELAALSWLAERLTLAEVLAEHPAHVIAIDFDRMLLDLEKTIGVVARHFGFDTEEAKFHAAAHSQVLKHYSKAPEHEYSPQLRAEILAQSREENAGEIHAGRAWLESLASRHARVAALME